MRDYPVPYSTREETPFIFKNLSIREMLWIGGGAINGFIIAVLLFVLSGARLENIILCMPVLIPFTGAGWYLAKKKVEEDDNIVTLDRHLLKKIKYKFRSHKYVNYRK